MRSFSLDQVWASVVDGWRGLAQANANIGKSGLLGEENLQSIGAFFSNRSLSAVFVVRSIDFEVVKAA
jgi:hypothetical protein